MFLRPGTPGKVKNRVQKVIRATYVCSALGPESAGRTTAEVNQTSRRLTGTCHPLSLGDILKSNSVAFKFGQHVCACVCVCRKSSMLLNHPERPRVDDPRIAMGESQNETCRDIANAQFTRAPEWQHGSGSALVAAISQPTTRPEASSKNATTWQ